MIVIMEFFWLSFVSALVLKKELIKLYLRQPVHNKLEIHCSLVLYGHVSSCLVMLQPTVLQNHLSIGNNVELVCDIHSGCLEPEPL